MRSGRRAASRSFVIFVVASHDLVSDPRCKLGITVSRRVGNSVVRNRVKRHIREWFRISRGNVPLGSDVVVVARRPARDLAGSCVSRELDAMVTPATGVTLC